jgi:aspartyl-tRNA(Asn)/glutamyl-tRNA(Gln) amidotransferase subunit A
MSPFLGRVEQFFIERASDDVKNVTGVAVERLEQAGANLAAVRLPDSFAEVHAMHRRIMAYEAAREHGEFYGGQAEQFGRHIGSLLQEGIAITDADYEAALDHQRRFSAQVREMLASVDALVMPATDTTAPADLTTTGNPAFQSPWSYAGVPVVSIPCGQAGDGMPCALQFVGRHGGEPQLLEIAAWCERVLSHKSINS